MKTLNFTLCTPPLFPLKVGEVTKGADFLVDRSTGSSDKRITTAADQRRGSSLQFARVYLGRTEIFDGKFALFSLIKMAIWTNLTESDGGE